MLAGLQKRLLRMEAFVDLPVKTEFELESIKQLVKEDSIKYIPERGRRLHLYNVHDLWRSVYPQLYKMVHRNFQSEELERKAHDQVVSFTIGIVQLIHEALDNRLGIELLRLLNLWLSRLESAAESKSGMTRFQESRWRTEAELNRKIIFGQTMSIFYTCVKFWIFYLRRWNKLPLNEIRYLMPQVSWLQMHFLLHNHTRGEHVLRPPAAVSVADEHKHTQVELIDQSVSPVSASPKLAKEIEISISQPPKKLPQLQKQKEQKLVDREVLRRQIEETTAAFLRSIPRHSLIGYPVPFYEADSLDGLVTDQYHSKRYGHTYGSDLLF
ncbi:hypothetical protein Ciccas_012309 [Cichlidogyrus casuarinus]|uniref:Uncharacterized protein n=1 Tax=Cichlidogyrus casuarinus TaxID=1844966 RepID=A0ABD2PPN7_9PLAT